MIFESSKMKLEVISTKLIGETNDCYICKDLKSSGGSLYTVIVAKDHECIKNVLEAFRRLDLVENSALVDSFACEGIHVLVFPYRRERNLFDFYAGELYSLKVCEDICINTIIACMQLALPYQLLYLLLTQNQLNLSSDNNIFMSYAIDLKDFDLNITEKDCVVECARIILVLLEAKASQKANSFILLQKKSANRSYSKFSELYRDITIAAVGDKRISLFGRLKLWLSLYSNYIFGVLFWICVILGIIALSLILSRFVLGNGSWLRIIFNNFKNIGTESLVQ